MSDMLILVSAGLYVLSSLLYRYTRIHRIMYSAGILLNISAAAWLWHSIGSPPLGNLHQVLAVMGVLFFPVYILLVIKEKRKKTAFMFPALGAVCLVLALIFKNSISWRRPPALQSVWFIPHVASYLISYVLVFAAFITGTAGIIKKRSSEAEDNSIESVPYRLIRYAFPLMTFGLVSGALWSDAVWTECWSWDTKEIWALITWLWYGLYLYAHGNVLFRKYAGVYHVLGFLSLITTFFLVNVVPFLKSALHSYS